MRQVVIQVGVALETLLRTGRLGLGSGAGHSQLMHVMAGSAVDPFRVMLGLHPINILLMVTLGKLIGIKIPNVACRKRGRFEIDFQSLSGLVANRPLHIFGLG
jgi:hypothetical protein